MAQRTGIDLQAESLHDRRTMAPAQYGSDHLSIERLIILVPDRGINSSELARRIWALAEPCAIPVLYLGLSGHGETVDGDARLRMITLASMTRDDKVQVDTLIASESNWVRAVHQVWKPGDAVICLAEHKVKLQYRGGQSLSQVIEAVLDIPVYVVPGMIVRERARHPEEDQRIGALVRLMSRLFVPILVMGVLLALQVRIVLTTPGVIRTLLLSITGLVEVGVLGMWTLNRH